ncbi:hypothetical protein KI387_027007, partial [Taxus chinensis]
TKNIIVLSESDDGEVPDPIGAPETTVEEGKEVPSIEPPSIADSFVKETPEVSSASLLEAIV